MAAIADPNVKEKSMISRRFYYRVLCLLVWLCEKVFCHNLNFDFDDDLPCPVPFFVTFDIHPGNGIIIKGDIESMEIREGQQFDIEAKLTTASGHPAAYQEGSAAFSSSNPDVVSVEQHEDNPLKATVKGLDGSNAESALIEFRADGDPDAEEIRDLVGTLDVTCSQGEAVVVALEVGPVSDTTAPETEEEPAPVEEPPVV